MLATSVSWVAMNGNEGDQNSNALLYMTSRLLQNYHKYPNIFAYSESHFMS
jgi:hypothetical protein